MKPIEAGPADGDVMEPFLGRRPVVALLVVTVLVPLAYLATQAYVSVVGEIPELERAFDMDQEGTVPTAWNSLLLAIAAGILVLAAMLRPVGAHPGRRSMYVAAGVVSYLAIDEAAELHELATVPADALLDRFDVQWLTYTWLLFGGIVAIALATVAIRWGRALPSVVRRRAGLALVAYLAGALVTEAINGWVYERRDGSQLRQYVYMSGVAVEETLEMIGCVIAISAFSLLLVLQRSNGTDMIRSATESEPRPSVCAGTDASAVGSP